MKIRLIPLSFALLPVLAASAAVPDAEELRPHAIFGSNMVIQRESPVTVWGKARPGGTVEVSLAGNTVRATAGTDGNWRAELPAIAVPGGSYRLRIAGKREFLFDNVTAGDIWICSGQSNMEWPVRSALNARQEIAAADHPGIRIFTVPQQAAYEQRDDLAASPWRVCSPRTIGWFSAVAYFFGRELNRELNVPVGLIDASWGGTSISPWLPLSLVERDPELRPIAERYDRQRARMTPEAVAAYDRTVAEWQKNPKPPRPDAPWGRSQYHPGTLYNAMIAPLFPLRIKGVVWYQGEANAKRARQYRKLLRLLVTTWRTQWRQEMLPFLIVQLPNYRGGRIVPEEGQWAELREAQYLATRLPGTALAVTCDIGEPENIHPLNKQEVGRRLALAALKQFYGCELIHSGPVFEQARFDRGRAEVSFTHIGGGLEVRNPPLRYFELAGKDRRFHPASARIDGNRIIVESLSVPEPVAVRYAWKNNPEGCNLYNREGLPAMPFRSDNWPGVTDRNR